MWDGFFIMASKGLFVKFMPRPPLRVRDRPRPTEAVILKIVVSVHFFLVVILGRSGLLVLGAVNLEVPPGPAANGEDSQHKDQRPGPVLFSRAPRAVAPW